MEFIQRKVYLELLDHLPKLEISLILGPRQAGKTTLMKKLMTDLSSMGKKSVYFNLDVIEDRQYFSSQHHLLEQIKIRSESTDTVVFIDEIQRLDDAGLFLKGLYDLGKGYKYVVTGSGSLELRANVVEPMTGRKKVFYCLPLSFSEFTSYKLKTDFGKVSDILNSNPFETDRLMQEYFLYGGYPRVVLSQTGQEKKDILTEIYRSYLEKDIQVILNVEKELAFGLLIKLLAQQTGNIVNRAELSSTLGINEKTVEKYLDLLEKTFVISLMKPYFTNARKELRKSPKVYFLDLGFLSLSLGSQKTEYPSGSIFENACYLRLLEKTDKDLIRFWRSGGGAEVDFLVLSEKNTTPTPIEVKLSGKTETIGKSLYSYIDFYHPDRIYILNRDKAGTTEKNGVKIQYFPYSMIDRLSI